MIAIAIYRWYVLVRPVRQRVPVEPLWLLHLVGLVSFICFISDTCVSLSVASILTWYLDGTRLPTTHLTPSSI